MKLKERLGLQQNNEESLQNSYELDLEEYQLEKSLNGGSDRKKTQLDINLELAYFIGKQ